MSCGFLDATAEAVRWLHDEKKLPIKQIAEQLNIAPKSVNAALLRDRKRSGMDPRAGHRESDAGGANKRREAIDESVIDNAVDRTPCVRCGTRRDHHAEFGCKSWRAL